MGRETAAHGTRTARHGAQGQDGLLGGTAGTGHALNPAGGCPLLLGLAWGSRGPVPTRRSLGHLPASLVAAPQTRHGAERQRELAAAANTFFAIFSPSAPCCWFQRYFFFPQ